MSAQHTPASLRRRASDNPETQARWAQVWIDADRRQPFRVEQAHAVPETRRRWWRAFL
jgi:hypothetical protein